MGVSSSDAILGRTVWALILLPSFLEPVLMVPILLVSASNVLTLISGDPALLQATSELRHKLSKADMQVQIQWECMWLSHCVVKAKNMHPYHQAGLGPPEGARPWCDSHNLMFIPCHKTPLPHTISFRRSPKTPLGDKPKVNLIPCILEPDPQCGGPQSRSSHANTRRVLIGT